MREDERYRQLAVFSVIVVEVVGTPLVIGGLLGLVFRNHPSKVGITVIGALAGLAIAFYRIGQMVKKGSKK
ncbi:MAG: hypothetical protein KGP28_02135 [Bdellovibrionales bacterium]|nr:hypothetical protein [Bdellovibrionales bacterium]